MLSRAKQHISDRLLMVFEHQTRESGPLWCPSKPKLLLNINSRKAISLASQVVGALSLWSADNSLELRLKGASRHDLCLSPEADRAVSCCYIRNKLL